LRKREPIDQEYLRRRKGKGEQPGGNDFRSKKPPRSGACPGEYLLKKKGKMNKLSAGALVIRVVLKG